METWCADDRKDYGYIGQASNGQQTQVHGRAIEALSDLLVEPRHQRVWPSMTTPGHVLAQSAWPLGGCRRAHQPRQRHTQRNADDRDKPFLRRGIKAIKNDDPLLNNIGPVRTGYGRPRPAAWGVALQLNVVKATTTHPGQLQDVLEIRRNRLGFAPRCAKHANDGRNHKGLDPAD